MAAVTICSDLGAPQNKVCHCCHCLPIYLPWNDGTGCHDHSFLNVELEANFFTLLFHFYQEFFSSSWLSAIRVVSFTYLRSLIFLLAILIPVCASSSPTFLMMFSSVQSLSCIQLFVTPWISACQASLFITVSWSSLRLMSIESVMPSSRLILGCPLLLLPSIPPSIRVSSNEVAKVLELQLQLQHHSFQRNIRVDLLQNGLVGSPCSPRDFQESSPTPQFKSINSSVLSLLHSPTLTSIHDHRKNHSLD